MESKLTQNEIDDIQKAFSDFIKMDGPRQPLPILMKKMFAIFNDYYDIVEPVLEDLQTLEYSSKEFGAFYPFLIDVTKLNDEEINSKKKISGVQRYLSGPLSLNNKLYLVSKEFYLDKGGFKKRLYSWFCNLYCIEKRNDIIDFSKEFFNDVEQYEKNKEEIKKLLVLLNQASSILFSAEKDMISKLIRAYKADEEIDDEIIRKVDNVISRLKRSKEILSKIDL